MTSSDVPPATGSRRRRARAEAPRTESVWVRLSPQEAAVVQAAAVRVGVSVGAWVGETAVRQARAEASGEGGGSMPSSWRELVGALVALCTEVVAGQRVPIVELGPALVAGELLDGPSAASHNEPDELAAGHDKHSGDGVVAVLRRIDAVTEAAAAASVASAVASAARGSRRNGRGSPDRS